MSSAPAPAPPRYVDTAHWARRDAFELFRGFEQPFFSLCVRMDVAPLKAWLAAQPRPGGFSLACHYLALRLSNEMQPFRLRLQAGADGPQGRPAVREHARVDGSTTVLRPDESFGFAQLWWREGAPYRFDAFRARGEAAFRAARERPAAAGEPGFAPPEPEPGDALAASGEATTMYFTTLPWVHFTAFMHARPGAGRDDSTPRVVFGGVRAEAGHPGAAQWMPVQLDVHHALMDGLQAGRWLQALEAALAAPQDWLG